jgi:Holliday junction resolvase RusA-like endonuclease
VRIVVYGTPAPQGSKRFVGNGRMIESSPLVKPWREAVKQAALAFRGVGITDELVPVMSDPLVVSIVFTLKRPSSLPKSRQFPARKPDLDKLVRSTFDALTDAGVWNDDSQVVSIIASKAFPDENEISSRLTCPGAVINVNPIVSAP